MKDAIRNLFAWKLAILARLVLAKYQPLIVMVTGSVGKTSTKDAVAAALSSRFYVRASEKSYNSEFGVPLTILGVHNPWSSMGAWIGVFGEAWGQLLFKRHYPNVLVLEVGADRPGDLARILRIATPDAVVVTRLPEVPVHVEAYATPEAVREEEFAPAYALAQGTPLILNADDEYALAMAARLSVDVRTFGFNEDASVRITEAGLRVEDGLPAGMKATLVAGEGSLPIIVPGALGRPQLYAPAAALALCLAFNISPEDAGTGLLSYEPPAGRARLLKGKDGSVLIDDSYNASPAAVEEALLSLSLLAAELKLRRVAVLGDMLELGRYSHDEHERIGELAARKVDVLFTVGVRARTIADAAVKAGMPEGNIRRCTDAEQAAEEALKVVGQGDAVLVKGSQSIRTERVAAALLASEDDLDLLVRQDREWQRR